MEKIDYFSIRPAKPEDLPAIGALMASVDMVIQFNEENCFVAKCAHRLLGFARVEYCTEIPYLRPIVVDPRYQNRGIGKALIQSILEWADGLTVVARGSASGFYHRLGFESFAWDLLPGRYRHECANCPDQEFCHPVPMAYAPHQAGDIGQISTVIKGEGSAR